MATIKEIAKEAGVSITTVSRVLNYDDTLSISTAKRLLIVEIAERLEYQTPRNRRKKPRFAQNQDERSIGLVEFVTDEGEIEDPYYLGIRMGIEKKCQEEQIHLIKFPRIGNSNPTMDIALDGVIFIGKFSTAEIREFEARYQNLVFIDSSPFEDLYDSVTIDIRKAVIKVLNFLIDKGYTRIGYIGGIETIEECRTPIGEKRYDAYIKYMKKKGLYIPKYDFIGDFTPQSGYKLMNQAIGQADLPEVFFVANDSIAIGALRALNEAKIKVPDTLGIIGFNDIPTASYTYPALTTVKIYNEFMGEKAVELMMERIDGRKIPVKIQLPVKVIERNTIK
ncbi:MAG: LacI family transcriptional regulator [Firmicutes bacterium HGW-Firmicutes-3]|jgi:LacI family transcriptional regulator|nr:MAG: LacI family transcriptional regulator [Firmicutes bacterium HGW-Firmicutes-3]